MDSNSQVFSEDDWVNTQAEVESQSSGSFIDDVKSMSNTTNNIYNKLDFMHRELTSLREAFSKHMETCGKNLCESEENSQSLLCYDSSSTSTSPRPTSVVITMVHFENSDHNLYVDRSVRDALYRATALREAIRILLVAIHGIPFLRKSTRTGLKRTARSSSEQSENPSVAEETVIPPLTLIQTHAVMKKLFPFKETITQDADLFQKEKKRRESDINKHVTSVLQYYKTEYNDTGSRVVKPKKLKVNSE